MLIDYIEKQIFKFVVFTLSNQSNIKISQVIVRQHLVSTCPSISISLRIHFTINVTDRIQCTTSNERFDHNVRRLSSCANTCIQLSYQWTRTILELYSLNKFVCVIHFDKRAGNTRPICRLVRSFIQYNLMLLLNIQFFSN